MVVNGADGASIGTVQNSLDINLGCSSSAAAQVLGSNIEGYTDWYLPSIDELTEMFNAIGGVAGFSSANWYWSSTESHLYHAWVMNGGNGDIIDGFTKNGLGMVRPIRNVNFDGCSSGTGTDATAFNYNSEANTDDGSCVAVVNGCTDSSAFNYAELANTDDGSRVAVVNGCTDSTHLTILN